MNYSNHSTPWPVAIPPADPNSKYKVLENTKGLPNTSYYNLFPQQIDAFSPTLPSFSYDNSFVETTDRDTTYMKQMYPMAVQKIQTYVEDECDKLEYDGSCMFDDCPDRIHLSVIVNVIYEKVKDFDFSNHQLKAEDLTNSHRHCFDDNCGGPPHRPPRPCFGGNCGWPRPPRRRPRPCGPGFNCPSPRSDYHPDGNPNWMKNAIEILLYNEMNDRRRRYRGRKKRFLV